MWGTIVFRTETSITAGPELDNIQSGTLIARVMKPRVMKPAPGDQPGRDGWMSQAMISGIS